MHEPVTFARLLVAHGARLSVAHDVLDQVAEGGMISLDLVCKDMAELMTKLGNLGVRATRVAGTGPDQQEVVDRSAEGVAA